MNGVHDLGGMDGFGPVAIETDEPVFHADWEKRVFGIEAALSGSPAGLWANIDEFRHAIERIPAPRYLDSSYYERWLDAILTLLSEHNIISRKELAERGTDPIAPAQSPNRFERAAKSAARTRARFRKGDRVVARNINPAGHTRLPRYVRGKRGVIYRDWGVYVFADTNAHQAGEYRQHVYSVAFKARELWGKNAPPHDTLRIDLWEDYLDSDAARPKPAARKRSK
jgi:nitrile hydratase beta subunit